MKRCHSMRFGGSPGQDGALFRLWAPAAKTVALRLASQSEDFAMDQCGDGWFERRPHGIGAGARYQFVIDGNRAVPDPASRFQPEDVGGPSELIDPMAFEWSDDKWKGRPWHEAVIYELHIGAFTREGTYRAAMRELERLARLGITAIELMPLADFAGSRNWGYDGVLPFAPDSSYGRPEELKALIVEAHRLGVMVFIDVVYNHFGPEGNYLPFYAPSFFAKRSTNWGQAIDFTSMARRFFIDNALYWLDEYHLDGLRLDAAHAIEDATTPHFLEELATTARRACAGREIHLMLENDKNAPHYLERRADGRPILYNAQWNDDFHHVIHVILTGETDGYYADYARDPIDKLGRTLTQGFIYQGERSTYRDASRGQASAHLPPLAFINFLQNHDQIGNRALGERMTCLTTRDALAAAAAVLLLAPSPPLLFMGEESGAKNPFLFFADFSGRLAEAVRDGRRREFARFPAFASSDAQARIPDPFALTTFERSRIDSVKAPTHAEISTLYQTLLRLRHREVIPRLQGPRGFAAGYHCDGAVLTAHWLLPDGNPLSLLANLSSKPTHTAFLLKGRLIWGAGNGEELAPWAVCWTVGT
jgi:maltooligosyltrehalose trehalohydrolase